MLGHWKNFDELESNLSMVELNELLTAMRKKEERTMKFQAAIAGVDLDDSEPEDITELQGARAGHEGFGAGEGLGFIELEG